MQRYNEVSWDKLNYLPFTLLVDFRAFAVALIATNEMCYNCSLQAKLLVFPNDCLGKLGNSEADRLTVTSDLESILTLYCKNRELPYESGNGWTEVLQLLSSLNVPKCRLYNVFFALTTKYIPRCRTFRRAGSARKAEPVQKHLYSAFIRNFQKPIFFSNFPPDPDPLRPRASVGMMAIFFRISCQGSVILNFRGCVRDGRPFDLFRLLLLYHDPQLCSFLDTRKITPDLYAKRWVRFCNM